tara:strand:- start:12301 stop:13821 length:1521 start_codon:yes stop_codon:yes gene_type:complete
MIAEKGFLSDSRSLIKSMLVIGSAQFVNILITIVRVKVFANLLGPSGVGLLSIYTSLQAMVKETAGLGMVSSGVREITSSRGDEAALSRVRRVLFAAHLIHGALAMLAVWLLRERIAIWLFGDAVRATEIGLIGIAVFLSLLVSAQTALLQGLRKIGYLGRVMVIGAFVGSLAGLVAVWLQGESGLIWFILAQPMAAVVIALQYTRRLPRPTAARLTLVKVWEVWKPMAKLGVAFMLGGLAHAATLLLVRGRISQELGLDAAGHFAAAWGITMTYVGFLIKAMGADYYPRLVEVIHDKVAAVRLMNEQVQLGLAIGGPVLLLMIGLAPWIITVLYSDEFGPAVKLLQWQTVGNVFVVASWAIGFSIIASARGKTFLLFQVNFNILFLLMLWPTLASFGIVAAGPAFTIAYVMHFTLLYLIVRSIFQFRLQPLSLALLAIHTSLAFALLGATQFLPEFSAFASVFLAVATGVFGVRVVLSKIGMHGSLPIRLYEIFERFGWPIQTLV